MDALVTSRARNSCPGEDRDLLKTARCSPTPPGVAEGAREGGPVLQRKTTQGTEGGMPRGRTPRPGAVVGKEERHSSRPADGKFSREEPKASHVEQEVTACLLEEREVRGSEQVPDSDNKGLHRIPAKARVPFTLPKSTDLLTGTRRETANPWELGYTKEKSCT